MTTNASTSSDSEQSYNLDELSYKQKGLLDYASDAWDAISSLSLLSPKHRVYKLEEEKNRYKEETGYTVADDPYGVIRGILSQQAFSVSLDPSGRSPMGLIGSLGKKSGPPKKITATSYDDYLKKFGKSKKIIPKPPPITPRKVELFDELADLQKGDPEIQMMRIQEITGGGPLSGVVEHGGDLVNRMARKGHDGGYEYAKDKIFKVHNSVTQGYGFEKEVLETAKWKAKQLNIPFEEYLKVLKGELNKFAKEHKKLPAYNESHKLVRDFNVAIGEWRFDDAKELITKLKAQTDKGSESFKKWSLAGIDSIDSPKTLSQKIRESDFKRIKSGPNKGSYIGAPSHINTPQKLKKLIENKYKYMEKGVPGRYWYSDSGEIIGEITPDTEMANKLTGSIGVTSQGTGVDPNLGHSIKAHSQRMVGDPVDTGRFPNKMGSSINKVYEGLGPELGPKRTPFSNQIALGGGFDPNPETAKRAVHDLWDARASEFGDDFNKGLTTAQHEFLDKVDDILIREANEKGLGGYEDWTTGRSQAAVWVAKKSEQEGMSIEEGAKSYVDYLEKYVAQGSYETIPGVTGDHFPELHGMSDEFKEEYHRQVKELLTKGGHDKFARGYGALSLGTLDAPGYYKGKFSPGTQVRILSGRETGGAWADASSAKIHRAMEGSRALVLDQDAAAWSQLGNAGEPLVRANAFLLNYGRPVNKEEIIDLMDELVAQYGDDALEDFAPVPSMGGMRLLYINPLPNYQKVGQLVKKIAKGKNIPVTTHKNIIKYPDGYTENNWAEQRLGQDFLPLINQTGNPIIKERFDAIVPEIADNLRIHSEKIAKKFGMTVSKDLQDMREAIARGGYDGLMKLIKTGVLPALVIGFIGVGLTQSQREKIGLVPLYPSTGS